jgi:hypothetical protein
VRAIGFLLNWGGVGQAVQRVLVSAGFWFELSPSLGQGFQRLDNDYLFCVGKLGGQFLQQL